MNKIKGCRGGCYDTENGKFLGKTGKISGFGDEKISILSEKRTFLRFRRLNVPPRIGMF